MIDRSEIQSLILRPSKAEDVTITFLTATREGLETLLDGTRHGEAFAVTWASDPSARHGARSIGLTAEGLRLLRISDRTRSALPAAFLEGMAAAARRLGDPEAGGTDWDPPLGLNGTVPAPDPLAPWSAPEVHAVVIDAGTTPPARWPSGVEALEPSWQGRRREENKEPFGFRDDISNPVIAGGPGSEDVKPGNGVWDARMGRWRAVAPGELLLGHVDEIGTIAGHPDAAHLERNGSYLVIRKLAQDVAGFHSACGEWAEQLTASYPDHPIGADDVAAQLVGRHPDGTPLGRAPGKEPANDFLYRDARFCPVAVPPSAHIRRANPRDALEFSDKTVSRHTLFRRGYPYGEPRSGDEGLLFLACCADLRRQFEFIQSSWLQDGDRFGLGLETDAIAGRRELIAPGDGQVSIDHQGRRERTSFESYVTFRGGEYVLLPSKSALALLGGTQPRP